MSNVGQSKKYFHDLKGYNHRLDNLQAAILEVKLRYLDDWNSRRQANAKRYQELLQGVDVVVPVVHEFATSVWHLYVAKVKDRDGLQKFLGERNIGTGIHYPVPIHLQEAYRDLGYSEGAFPVAEEAAREIISLPMHADLTEEDIQYVVDSIKAFFDQ